MVDDIETDCEGGVWNTRWQHGTEPFATGGSRERQITKGAVVARWHGVNHIIRDPDGSIAEHNSYRPAAALRQRHDGNRSRQSALLIATPMT
jgi:hypothetical protein